MFTLVQNIILKKNATTVHWQRNTKVQTWRVMAELLSASDSSSGVSKKQSVGSSPSYDTCGKAMVPCVV